MSYTCTIHTEYVDASNTEDVLANATRTITEALEEKEERYEKGN